tara:strand:+ start:280 stop:624 length:345 start_codon:yes stop_codon:yes gene_type:complete
MSEVETVTMRVRQGVEGTVAIDHPWIGGLEPCIIYDTEQEEKVPLDVLVVAMLNSFNSENDCRIDFPSEGQDLGDTWVEIHSWAYADKVRDSADCPALIAKLESIVAILKGGVR